MRTRCLPLFLLLTTGVPALMISPAGAQQHHAAARVPVTVALVERLPTPDAPFVILRRPSVLPADVILLPATADAPLLSDAVRALLLARRNLGGDHAGAPVVLRARYRRGGGDARPVLPWSPRVLNDLRRASPRPIAGVGEVRAVEIWLPRQR